MKQVELYKLNADTAYIYKAKYAQCVVAQDWHCAIKAAKELSAKAVVRSGRSVILVNGVDINAIPELNYIQIVGWETNVLGLNRRVVVCIDYGQEYEFGNPPTIENASGKNMKFESMVAALNYTAANGWEYVDSYNRTVGTIPAVYYLMRRKN